MATVRVIRNIGLGDQATSSQTSTVDEPTAAASGNNIFVTGNWFASKSNDGGNNWSLVDPFTQFPQRPVDSAATRSSSTSQAEIYGSGSFSTSAAAAAISSVWRCAGGRPSAPGTGGTSLQQR